MKYLMVSRNCGASYEVAAESDSIFELELLAAEPELEGLRWFIDDDDDDELVESESE